MPSIIIFEHSFYPFCSFCIVNIHKVHQPRETDVHGPTNPAQGDALWQQAFKQRTLSKRHAPLDSLSDKLSWTRLALMMLIPIFLNGLDATPGRRLYRSWQWLLPWVASVFLANSTIESCHEPNVFRTTTCITRAYILHHLGPS